MALTMRADSINNPEHWRKRAEEMCPGGSPGQSVQQHRSSMYGTTNSPLIKERSSLDGSGILKTQKCGD
jgi:hypothetical protein